MNPIMRISFYSLLLLLLTVGCREESVIPSPNPGEGNVELPDGRVAFAIHTTSPTFQRPVTRIGAAAEDQINGDVWVFVFDASNEDCFFLEAVKATDHQATATPGQSRRTVNLKVRNHKVTLLVLANAPSKIYNGTSEVTLSNDPASWGLTTATKLAEARSLLSTIPLASPSVSEVPYTPSLSIPMSAEMDYNKLDASVYIGTESAPLPLLRVVAKLSVKKDFASTGTSVTPKFTLKGATVYNAPRNTSLFPVHKSNATNLTHYIGTSGIGDEIIGIAPAVNDSTMMNPIYLYPSAEANVDHQPFVLIQARYADDLVDTYYKLAIAPVGKPRGHVERNANYRFLIKECTGRGYATIQDAIAAPSSKLMYTVEVTDLSSHDILDNGQYYIGLSNSEYHFYAYNSFVNLPIATLHTGNNSGTDTFTGNVTITSSDPEKLIVQTPIVSHPISNGHTILASVTKEFTQGILTVRLGNLTKQIKVVRKSNSFLEIKNELIVNNTYKDAKYKVASVVNPKSWIKLSTTPKITLETGQDLVASNAGGVYIAYNANMAKPDLENFVYVSRADSGRIKAHFLLAPLEFINTNAPNVIDRNAQRLGGTGAGPYNFYFNNPSTYNYKVALFPDDGSPTTNTGVQSNIDVSAQKEMEYSNLNEQDRIKLPRMFVAKVQVGDYWYEIDYHVQQRFELTINILTVGRNGIDYHRNSDNAIKSANDPSWANNQSMFGERIGTATRSIECKYGSGLGRLLYNQTGIDKPNQLPIKVYAYFNGIIANINDSHYRPDPTIGNDSLLSILFKKNIDILVCFVHGENYNSPHGPTKTQAEWIINKWLLQSKYRGMIYTCDHEACNPGWNQAIFGQNHLTRTEGGELTRLSGTDLFYNHRVFKSIWNGPYSQYEKWNNVPLLGSDITQNYPSEKLPGMNTGVPSRTYNRNIDTSTGLSNDMRDPKIPFYAVNNFGYMPLAVVQDKGFIPLLYLESNGQKYVTLAVHPDKRIVFQGEYQYYDIFDTGGQYTFMNANGSLAPTKYGQYPKLMMNLWDWFFNNVALGKKY